MNEQRRTKLETPHAHTWDDEWADCVDEREGELGRRICGAKTLAGNPCTLTSGHKTGRCAFHGGTDAIGAPVGNSNARIHGLYARRLQRCGTHCPMWQHCPFATAQVLKLELPERPNCAYETAEYEAVLEELEDDGRDALPRVHDRPSGHAGTGPSLLKEYLDETDSSGLGGPSSSNNCTESVGLAESRQKPQPRWNLALPGGVPDFRAHNLALLQVMVSRAAAALSVTTFTDDVTSDSERYHMHTTKMHAALEAFLRLTREHRATFAQFQREQEQARKADAETSANGHVPSLADIATPILERADGVLEEAIAAENERRDYVRRLESMLTERVGQDWKSDPGFIDSG